MRHVGRFGAIEPDLRVAVSSLRIRFQAHLRDAEIMEIPECDLHHGIIPFDTVLSPLQDIGGWEHRDEPTLAGDSQKRDALGKRQFGESLEGHPLLFDE